MSSRNAARGQQMVQHAQFRGFPGQPNAHVNRMYTAVLRLEGNQHRAVEAT